MRKDKNFGFTFMELIIVVTVIGILSSLFIAGYPATQRRARDAERKSDIKQYQTAMESYANSHDGNYPAATVIGNASGELCNTLGTPACPNDSYDVFSTSTLYVLWATLEQEDDSGNTQYFVVCSDGRSGDTTSIPTNSCTLP